MPVSRSGHQMVASPDKKTLYAIGGDHRYGGPHREVYKFYCTSDINSCKWAKTNIVLKYGRRNFVAFPIPNSLADKLCK